VRRDANQWDDRGAGLQPSQVHLTTPLRPDPAQTHSVSIGCTVPGGRWFGAAVTSTYCLSGIPWAARP